MSEKKWDDKKEGKKPWEHGYVAPKKPTAAAKKKKKKKRKAGPGSVAEDIHDEMVSRNKKIVKHVGGWSKSDK
jgi:hypothetical protein